MTQYNSKYDGSRYSIKNLENLTGIKAHTLRIWEQRYNLVEPERTQTNIRFYTDEQLKFLMNIALLNKNGFKISKLAQMDKDQIKKAVFGLNGYNVNNEKSIISLTEAMLDLDEEKFNEVINQNNYISSFENTIVKILLPFLRNVGILWLSGSINPGYEHFISALIRQKLISTIERIDIPKTPKETIVLFNKEKELHEITLLICSYLFKLRNYKVIYLGTNLPYMHLKSICRKINPDRILTVITSYNSRKKDDDLIRTMAKQFDQSKLMFCGNLNVDSSFEFYNNVELYLKMEDLIEAI